MKNEDIINRRFSRAFMGYDIEEVDAFLDEVIRENERMSQQLELTELRVKILTEEIERRSGRSGGAIPSDKKDAELGKPPKTSAGDAKPSAPGSACAQDRAAAEPAKDNAAAPADKNTGAPAADKTAATARPDDKAASAPSGDPGKAKAPEADGAKEPKA